MFIHKSLFHQQLQFLVGHRSRLKPTTATQLMKHELLGKVTTQGGNQDEFWLEFQRKPWT